MSAGLDLGLQALSSRLELLLRIADNIGGGPSDPASPRTSQAMPSPATGAAVPPAIAPAAGDLETALLPEPATEDDASLSGKLAGLRPPQDGPRQTALPQRFAARPPIPAAPPAAPSGEAEMGEPSDSGETGFRSMVSRLLVAAASAPTAAVDHRMSAADGAGTGIASGRAGAEGSGSLEGTPLGSGDGPVGADAVSEATPDEAGTKPAGDAAESSGPRAKGWASGRGLSLPEAPGGALQTAVGVSPRESEAGNEAGFALSASSIAMTGATSAALEKAGATASADAASSDPAGAKPPSDRIETNRADGRLSPTDSGPTDSGSAGSSSVGTAVQTTETVDGEVQALFDRPLRLGEEADAGFGFPAVGSAVFKAGPLVERELVALGLFREDAPPGQGQPERAGVIASFVLNAAMIPGWPPPRPIVGVALTEFKAQWPEAAKLSKSDLELLLYLANLGFGRKQLNRILQRIEDRRRRSKVLRAIAAFMTNLDALAKAFGDEAERMADETEDEARLRQRGHRARIDLR